MQSARVTIKISERSKMDPTSNEREVSSFLQHIFLFHCFVTAL